MDSIAILVLAAGKSSRMKDIKQLLKIKNKTLLEITLENALKTNSKNVFCVLGANADKIKSEIHTENIQFIKNENFEKGLSSSIISGINYFKNRKLYFDGIFILLADQPAIEVTYLEAMLNLFQTNKDKIIASNYGGKLGVPVIFPVKHFSDLLLIVGDKGAKEYINNKKSEVLYSKLTTNFFDIDTKEDLLLYKNSILK
ncbi:MAG: nucleotidyltransferase family protein [Polaribacter sp.]|uniref:nucleotidyltransferase family protein n=1 Tax=Polaribacter sp. TaxID=1920175 RepID=UPI002F358AC5